MNSVQQVRQEFYLLHEAATVLGVSSVTIWRWIKTGKLEAHRIGREVLLDKHVVDVQRKYARRPL